MRTKRKKFTTYGLPTSNLTLISCALQQELSKEHFKFEKPRSRRRGKGRQRLSLAQKLSLAPLPPKKLNKKEWNHVKKTHQKRKETSCCICLEEYAMKKQVILNCTHSFHSTCLKAYEKYSGCRICPICRKNQYQKKVIRTGKNEYIRRLVVTVQSVIRTRNEEKMFLELYMDSNPEFRREYVCKKISKLNDKIEAKVKHGTFVVNKLMQEVEMKVSKSKLLLLQDNDWKKILHKSIERRKHEKCAICLDGLNKDKRHVCYTSCTHVFHHNCLNSFVRFSNGVNDFGKDFKCPICREICFVRKFEA